MTADNQNNESRTWPSEGPAPFRVSFDDSDYQIVELSNVQSAIMPLVVTDLETFVECIGTCFTISNKGILVTAQHVLNEAIEVCEKHPNSAIHAMQIPSDLAPMAGVRMLHAGRAYAHPEVDLAILSVGEIDNLPVIAIDFNLPETDGEVLTLGYTKFRGAFTTKTTVDIDLGVHASRGRVLDVYEKERDATMPYPCWSSDARVEGGMSGGPAFRVLHSNGSIAASGVCTSEYPANEAEGDERSTSFFTPLITMLAMNIDVTNDDGDAVSLPLLDLAKKGWFSSEEDFNTWHLLPSADGATVQLQRRV